MRIERVMIGHNEDLCENISAAYKRVRHLLENTKTVFITCIDSHRDLEASPLVQELTSEFRDHCELREIVRIHGNQTLEVLEHWLSIFWGFDEVWFFSSSLTIDEWPRWRLTSDQPFDVSYIRDAPEMRAMRAWAIEKAVLLAIGDGCGLNYVTIDPIIEKTLRSA